MRKYEVMFIVRPDVPEEELDKLVSHMEEVVTGANGKIEKVDKMGRRRLAYRVKRNREGFYVLFTLEGTGETVKEFERRLKLTDTVIKYLTVRVDEELKRAEKQKALRTKEESKRRKSKPAAAPPSAAPSTPSASPSGAEAVGA